jgi:hypothetical protein
MKLHPFSMTNQYLSETNKNNLRYKNQTHHDIISNFFFSIIFVIYNIII